MLRLLFAFFTSLDRPLPEPRDEEQGFTLVELMVVIVIIGLLATVVLINVLPSQDRAMTTKARADIATLEQAMEMYRLDNFTYPSDLNALVAPAPGADASRFRSGGYVKRLPDDPWRRPYQLAVPGKAGPFDIYSLGSDGAPGGSDDKADIFSGQN
ncbi:MAG: type II secretion system major pseudopilin GspG [Sphingomonas bacterium]|nr:type II secretion system major pseudopilin GspG [Sphingomonas bacterium]